MTRHYQHARRRGRASLMFALAGLGVACAVLAVVIILAVTT